MPELRRRITEVTASAIRRWVVIMELPPHQRVVLDDYARVLRTLDMAGVYAPIRVEQRPTDRAHCRLCGHRILQGSEAIAFAWDSKRERWGHLSTCYLHARFCPPPVDPGG